MTTTPGDPAGCSGDGAPDAAATHTSPASTPAPAVPIPPPEHAGTDGVAQAAADTDASAASGPESRPREAATPQPSHPNDAASEGLSPTRPAYMQQFTLTTQLILNRMRGGEGGGLSSALASAAANTPRAAILSPTYEDVRRRLLDGMSTSTMQMPSTVATAPVAPFPSAGAAPAGPATPAPLRPAGLSAIQKVNAGGVLSAAKPRGKTAGAGTPGRKPRASTGGAGRGGAARAGPKRKRVTKSEGAGVDDSSSLSDPSGLSDAEGSGATTAAAGTASASASASSTPLTTTKSGRQVQRPETYNPVAMELASGSGHKRRRDTHHHHGGSGGKQPRTAEQALCRLCSRLAFTKANQMVFCDGCNDAWHQSCHEPRIDDSFVSDAKKQWHCSACMAKQDRREAVQQAKRIKVVLVEPAKSKVSWAGRTPGQIRAYLSALPHAELVEMVMRCTSLYPHMAIFPPDNDGAGPKTPLASTSGNTINTPAAAAPVAPTPAAPAGRRQMLALNDGTWEDPAGILEAWKRPRPGAGPPTALAARLQAFEAGPGAHLEDLDDFASFSHSVYDGRGRRVEETGIRV
ncbi:hypothetical protein RB595_007182 [Gaeumannomyces hyphopodioides]